MLSLDQYLALSINLLVFRYGTYLLLRERGVHEALGVGLVARLLLKDLLEVLPHGLVAESQFRSDDVARTLDLCVLLILLYGVASLTFHAVEDLSLLDLRMPVEAVGGSQVD